MCIRDSYHGVVTFFMEFYRDDVDPDIAAELFPGTDPSKPVSYTHLDVYKRQGLVDAVNHKICFTDGSELAFSDVMQISMLLPAFQSGSYPLEKPLTLSLIHI